MNHFCAEFTYLWHYSSFVPYITWEYIINANYTDRGAAISKLVRGHCARFTKQTQIGIFISQSSSEKKLYKHNGI